MEIQCLLCLLVQVEGDMVAIGCAVVEATARAIINAVKCANYK